MSSSAPETQTRDDQTEESVRERAAEAYEATRERTSAAYEAARERASSVYDKAKSGVARGRERTAEELNLHPIGAVIGGFALGAVAAALLPRTERETQAFGQVGHKLTDAAREAARSAAEAGRGQIDEFTGQTVTKVGHAVVDAVQGIAKK